MTVSACGIGDRNSYPGCTRTPNLDRITAALDEMGDTAHRMAARVHNIESDMQVDAMWAMVDFIRGDGWSLAVITPDGVAVHEWGGIASDCIRPCIDPDAVGTTNEECRSMAIGASGHFLCGSREVE